MDMLLTEPESGSRGVFALCLKWLELLAAENYQAAFAALYHPEVPGWTPELLQMAVETYGAMDPLAGEVYRVTPFETAIGENPHRHFASHPVIPQLTYETHPEWPISVIWVDAGLITDSAIGTVDLQFALNGEWSDLSCSFYIHRLPEGLALELDRLDVA